MDGGEKKEVRRPMNAFLIFCKRHRGFVREKNPDMDNRSVTRVLGDLWANLGEEKKIYTNLAKQYKDAFMKANPNYKWHSADKSQCSTTKVISKPTNSRVIKNVAEIHTDGGITPGKLADPDKMGGLNLLLMADKETCDSRSLSSSSALFSVTRTSTASFSTSPAQASVNSTEQSSVFNSALLQLAEMCASELRSSSDDKPIPNQLTPLTLTIPPSSLVLLDSPNPSHHAMPPPKKRARHWSLTESDTAFETTNDNSSREYVFGSMSLQNTSLQKLRCTSVGSAACSEDKFSSLEKYKQPPSRRKLSSSATESIPSPSAPFADDADSPVFSPENSFSGDSKLENNECFDQIHRNFSQWSDKIGKCLVPVSDAPSDHSSLELEEQPLNQKLMKPKKQTKLAAASLLSHQPGGAFIAGVSRSGLWSERKEQPVSDHIQHTSRHGLLLPLRAEPSPGTCEDREIDARPEKDSSPDFYTWREPGKSKSKIVEVAPGSLNLKVISNSATEHCPLSLLWLNQHDGNMPEHKNQHNVARFGSAIDAKTPSSVLSGDFNSTSSSCSIAHEDTSFSRDRKISSILNNLDAPTAKYPLKFPHGYEALSAIDNDCSQNEFSSSTNETDPYLKTSEQGFPAQKMSAGVAKNSVLNLKTYTPKQSECGSLTSIPPTTSQSKTFSEGKLKKKWAERMLIESRQNEDLTHQRDKVDKDALTRNDPFNIVKSTQLETDANQNISPMDSTLESSKKRNLNDGSRATTSSFCSSESEDLKMSSTEGHRCRSTLDILKQPLYSLEGTQTHPRSHKPPSASSNTKLMFHPSQDQQPLKLGQVRPDSCSVKAKIKFKTDNNCSLSVGQRGQKLFSQKLHDNNSIRFKTEAKEPEDVINKQTLNQVTSYGKWFMDHVEQLCKTDFSEDKQQIEAKAPGNCVPDKKSAFAEVKSEPGNDFDMGIKEEIPVRRIKTEEKRENSLNPAGSSVKEVHSSPPSQTEGSSLGRTADQETSNMNPPFSEIKSSAPLNSAPISNHALTRSAEESSRKWETSRRSAASPSIDACFQNQWFAVVPESCDQSDLNEEAGIQPLRKSRRPNRGQKYQELIKEGFIQPSRERLAARNADRHGRSFGTREEFEKMEMKRTLKRSASERDTPSESPAISCNNSAITVSEASAEHRFTSGDFDLEKEIESLPVCSLDQLDKKRVMRRRCDSDTLGSPPCHRSSVDATNSLARTSSGSSQAKLSPHTSSASKFEAVDLCEPGCPAPHIPLPKEERPTEPITGSRKRKARKHCITRISFLDDKTSTAEAAFDQKSVQPIPSALPHKKLCSLPEDAPRISVGESDKNTSDSSRIFPQVQMTPLVKMDTDTVVSERRDLKIDSFNNTASAILSAGNIISTGKALDKVATSNANIPPAKNGLTSSSQLLSALSVVPPIKAASLLLSSPNKHCGSQLAFTAHKKNKGSLLPPVPTTLHSSTDSTIIIPKTSSTGTTLKTSPKATSTTITDHPILIAKATSATIPDHPILLAKTSYTIPDHPIPLETENAHSLITKINSEESRKQLITLSALKTKIPPVCVLSSKELPTKKSLERKPKKIVGGTSETSEQDLQFPISKSQCTLKRKLTEKKISPVLSRSSNTPLVSALLGHSDLSSVIKLADRGDGRVMALKTSTTSGKSNSKCNAVSQKTMRVDFPPPVFAAFKTQFIPLDVGQSHSKSLIRESASPKISSKSIQPLLNYSTHRTSIVTSTAETFLPSSETLSSSDRLPFPASSRTSKSLADKHHSALLPSKLTNLFITETVGIKQQHGSVAVSQLPQQHANLVAASCSSNNPDPYSSRTYASIQHTGAILHNSLLNQVPSAVISSSSSSSGVCTSSSPFVASTSPLLSLVPPHSSSAVLPPTVISLATSAPSSKTDIVSYTVIGSSTVVDAGSPHMIGSSHLPESPSVAIVKS